MAGWVRVDTNFTTHPKVLEIGPLGEALWLRGLCYAGEHLTDGFVPSAFIRRMSDLNGIEVAQRLVDAGLWIETDKGYVIHERDLWSVEPERLPANEWIPLRQRVFERDNFTCRYCGQTVGRLECDHVIPVSRGGTNALSNLATACFACNRSKRDYLLEEWTR